MLIARNVQIKVLTVQSSVQIQFKTTVTGHMSSLPDIQSVNHMALEKSITSWRYRLRASIIVYIKHEKLGKL